MDKPLDKQLVEKFSQFLEENGYILEIGPDKYGESCMKVTFPNGVKIELNLYEFGEYSSKDRYIFNQEKYDQYNENNRKSGNNLPPANPDDYWEVKREGK